MKGRFPLIDINNVSMIYPDGSVGIKNLDLKIDKGEFVFLTGKSGSGKSTIIKLLIKELDPTYGIINIFNQNLSLIKKNELPFLRRKIGVLFQNSNLIENKTLYENVAFALRVTEYPSKLIKVLVPAALSLVGLENKKKFYPNQISGGEKSRIALARAIVTSPQILIADEPTSNLDPDISWDIMCLLKEINRNGTTVIVSTHSRELVDIMGKRVITLNGGRVVMDSKNGKYFAYGLPDD